MDPAARPVNAYRFLDWQYEPGLRRLVGNGSGTRLKPLPDRLLRCLLDAAGSVVARDDLIERVWTRREVNDEVLSRAIAELRAVLGDDAREPRYIETLPKGGYRWIAPVARIEVEGELPVASMSRDAAKPPSRLRRNQAIAAGGLAAAILLGAGLWKVRGPADGNDAPHASIAVALLAARPLAVDRRLESDARFDPAGRVVYVRAARGGASELVMVDPATLAERVLWQDQGLRLPAPSPDGSEVAVTRHADGRCEVWAVALVDLRRSRLADCAASVAGGLEWADSGRSLILTGVPLQPGADAGLVLLDRRGGTQRVLTSPAMGEGAHADPRLSFDGTRLVYASKHNGEGQLWETDWPGMQDRRPLLVRPDPVYGHAFEPAGAGLWIAGDLTRYRALHRLLPGGEPELIGGRGARSVDLSADGDAIWSEATYDADIRVRTGIDAPWQVIARSNRYESQPEFSPDGNRVALISNRGGSESVFVHDLRDGSVRALSLDPAQRWVRPTWSMREDALVITAYANRHTRLFRFRLDGDRAQPIEEAGDGAFHGTELAGRLVYMTGNGGGRGQLMQRRPGQATAEDLGIGIVTAYRASPGWLAWRNEGSTVLHAAPWPSLHPVREIATGDASEALALAGDVLYYLDQDALWSVRLPDGLPERVDTDRVPDGNGPSLAASTQGAIALVSLTSVSIDIMIAEGVLAGGRPEGLKHAVADDR